MTCPSRWIIAGDSIMTYTFQSSGIGGHSSELTASRIPMMTNVFISNFSGGGQRMCSGGIPGFGLVNQKSAITYINGGLKADGIIIALGVNDAGAPEVGAIEFISTYRAMIQHLKSCGMQVVVALPVWNYEENLPKPHVDGSYTLVQFRHYAAQVAYAEGAHVFITDNIGLLPEHFADGTHMTGEGHGIYTCALVAQMQQWWLWP